MKIEEQIVIILIVIISLVLILIVLGIMWEDINEEGRKKKR